jgi:hypothetical protein
MPYAVSKLCTGMKTNRNLRAGAAHRWLRPVLAVGTVLLLAPLTPAQTFTALDAPLGVNGTSAWGISGSNVVGIFIDSTLANHGFLYNGTSYTTLDDPLAGGSHPYTYAYGIDGSTAAGIYSASSGVHGFLYNSGTYTTVDVPGATGTYIRGISGNNLVGYYDTPTHGARGFFYDGSSYTTLSDPLGAPDGTIAYGVDGNTVVGYYTDPSGVDHGFIYSGGTYTTLDNPLGVKGTILCGVSGNTIVGLYLDSATNYNSFIYNGSTFTSLQDPLAAHTYVSDLSGNTLVGETVDSSHLNHGFITTLEVPEPSAVTFGALVPLLWIRARYRTLHSLRTSRRAHA